MIKGTTYKENITFISLYIQIITADKYIRQINTQEKYKLNLIKIQFKWETLNTSLRTGLHKHNMSKGREELSITTNKFNRER